MGKWADGKWERLRDSELENAIALWKQHQKNDSDKAWQSQAKTYEQLCQTRDEKPQYLIDGLLVHGTTNITVGDSGLGKTPLKVMQALCVAHGIPFLGMATQKGKVLFTDYENGGELATTIGVVAKFLGVPPQSENLLTLPALEERDLKREIEFHRPSLVIVDTLRGLCSDATKHAENAAPLIGRCNKVATEVGCTWDLLHHIRKENRDQSAKRPKLDDKDARVLEWLEEAAGTRALVNLTYTRMAIDRPSSGDADLIVRTNMKLNGDVGRWLLGRKYEHGEPVGYVRFTGMAQLPDGTQRSLEKLPLNMAVSWTKACEVMGVSEKSASLYLKAGENAGVIKVDGKARTASRTYMRIELKE